MQPHHHPTPAPILNRMMQSDPAGPFHILKTIKALQKASDNIRCFREAELLYTEASVSVRRAEEREGLEN